jgi:hypothetical protein
MGDTKPSARSSFSLNLTTLNQLNTKKTLADGERQKLAALC